MNTIRRLAAIVLASALALAATACKPEPEPGTVDLVSDSIGYQATGGEDVDGFDDFDSYLWLGFTASDVLPWVQDQVQSGRPETLIVALGINDAAPRNGGWTWSDISTWVDLLDAPHESACVVVILPAVGEGASAELAAQVDTARADIAYLVGQRTGPTVIEDWGIVIDADPSVLGPDGVHLRSGPDGVSEYAADAVTNLYLQGADQCPQ